MEWTNDQALEFIEAFSKEPVLWDPNHKQHKNRYKVAEAWVRLQKSLSDGYTVDMLKRKRNSLMTHYRDCLKKIKESAKSASKAEDVHQPVWFAFDSMHEFLGELYQSRPTFSTEVYLFTEENSDNDNESDHLKQTNNYRPPVRESKVVRSEDSDSFNGSESAPEDPPSPPSPPRPKIRRREPTSTSRKSVNSSRCSSDDECDMYGQLLATKLKKLEYDDRLRLMNDIDNLAYKHLMQVRGQSRSTITSTYTIQ